jgi:TctA family transporter
MWVGNLMLLVINLPMIGIWVKLLQVPYKFMYPAILIFCAIGVYSINNNVFDVYQTLLFGILGYLFSKLRMEPAPLLIGFVLGPMMEEHLRRAMLLSRGDPSVFIDRPISATLLGIGAIALLAMLLPNLRRGKDNALAG